MNNFQIATIAYKHSCGAAREIEENMKIKCDPPQWIEVNGEVFFREHLLANIEHGKIIEDVVDEAE